MGTKAELIAQVLDYSTNDEDSYLANIPNFIRSAEERVWFFIQVPKFRKTVSGLTEVGEELLNLPTDFLALASLWTTDGTFRPIDLKDETYLREVYPDVSIQARPKVFAQKDDDTVLLAPVPDQAYPLQLTYFYRPASLADGADDGTTWLSTHAFETLKYGVLMEGAIYMKLQETPVFAEYKEQFQGNLMGLKNLGEVRLRKDTNRGGEKRGFEQ